MNIYAFITLLLALLVPLRILKMYPDLVFLSERHFYSNAVYFVEHIKRDHVLTKCLHERSGLYTNSAMPTFLEKILHRTRVHTNKLVLKTGSETTFLLTVVVVDHVSGTRGEMRKSPLLVQYVHGNRIPSTQCKNY